MLKGWLIFILITAALWGEIAGLSESQQPTQDPQIEQVLMEAHQVSSELADKVRGLLLKEIEKGGVLWYQPFLEAHALSPFCQVFVSARMSRMKRHCRRITSRMCVLG